MKKHFTTGLLISWLLIAIGCLNLGCATSSERAAWREGSPPDHLVFMVFDAMRPDYVDRFQMKNFQKLRERSRFYPQARLGYLGAETVVTHSVLGTGMPPKDLPWQDNDFFDRQGKIGEAGKFYSLTDVSMADFVRLQSEIPRDQFLVHQIKSKLGQKVISIGEKNYATTIFGTPYADSIITLKREGKQCAPFGRGIPSYIAENPRFSLDCGNFYGTESTYYPLDGNHYVPGHDPARLGGDVWTADAAELVIQKENWSGLLLTFGGIDKVAHMLGEQDGKRPHQAANVKTEYDLRKLCEVADAQLGKVLAAIDKAGLKDRTVVVVTADHGGQSNYRYLGAGRSGKIGKRQETAQSKWVSPYASLPAVKYTFQDSAVRIWLNNPEADPAEVVTVLSKTPGLVEIYRKAMAPLTPSYQRVFSRLDKQPAAFRRWAEQTYADALASYASVDGPDLVGIMADGTGFDLLGDHGGLQEGVQRVPLFIRVPHEAPNTNATRIRSFEIKAQILDALKLGQ